MNWNEAMRLIQNTEWLEQKPGLERMHLLLDFFGNPEKSMHFVHIAGTNGKGSASAMLSSVLRASGLRTGLYISPHLLRINERMSVNGKEITDTEFASLAGEILHAVRLLDTKPTKFEILTLMALLFFREKHCDIAVLEVGLGGRLDATNAIGTPDCALIMNIGLEHTEILGDTLEKIAFEKAGIIKPDAQVILYRQTAAVMETIKQCCTERHAVLTVTDPSAFRLQKSSLSGQCFDYRNRKELELSLLGSYQTENAMAVLDAADVLIRKGFPIPEAAVRKGLSTAVWPGRFELLSENPIVLLDGAHNPNGVAALCSSIRTFLPDRRLILLMGVMADKNYPEMLRLISPYAKAFIAEVPDSTRALSRDRLQQEIAKHFSGPVYPFGSVSEGLEYALRIAEPDDAVVCFGSLYQVAAIRRHFGLS